MKIAPIPIATYAKVGTFLSSGAGVAVDMELGIGEKVASDVAANTAGDSVGFFVATGLDVGAFVGTGVGVLVGLGVLALPADVLARAEPAVGVGWGVGNEVGSGVGVGVGVGKLIAIITGSVSELLEQDAVYLLTFRLKFPFVTSLSPILVTKTAEVVAVSEILK
jgi:hypothetical protein